MYTYTNTKLHSQQIYELMGNYNVSQEVKLVVYVLDLNATRIVLFVHTPLLLILSLLTGRKFHAIPISRAEPQPPRYLKAFFHIEYM